MAPFRRSIFETEAGSSDLDSDSESTYDFETEEDRNFIAPDEPCEELPFRPQLTPISQDSDYFTQDSDQIDPMADADPETEIFGDELVRLMESDRSLVPGVGAEPIPDRCPSPSPSLSDLLDSFLETDEFDSSPIAPGNKRPCPTEARPGVVRRRVDVDVSSDTDTSSDSESEEVEQQEVVVIPCGEDVPEFVSDRSKRFRRFALTLNNPTTEELEAFQGKLGSIAKFWCFGKENFGVPGKTPHLQCYVETIKGPFTIAAFQALMSSTTGIKSRYAMFGCKGTADQNIAYCSKDGDFWSAGVKPKGQGKRSDLVEVAAAASSGQNLMEIAVNHPTSFMKYSNGIVKFLNILRSAPRSEMTLGYWCFGKTGTGKSRWAHSLTPESTFVKDGSTKWFCGYNGENTVVIDDYRCNANLGFSFLLRLVDRYPLPVEMKGGNAQFNSRRVIVTTPLSIEDTFRHLDWMKEGDLDQMKRRFVELEFGVGGICHNTTLADLPPHPSVPVDADGSD